MSFDRRDFLKLSAAGIVVGVFPGCATSPVKSSRKRTACSHCGRWLWRCNSSQVYPHVGRKQDRGGADRAQPDIHFMPDEQYGAGRQPDHF